MIDPVDRHDDHLLSHVHPPDWRNPSPSGRYNLVVLGAGTAGLVAAAGAAGLGAKVALVEREMMGGDCLNVGCVPSKALISASRVVADARLAGKFGVRVQEGLTVDFPAVMERMRRLRAELSPHDSASRFRELGVDVYFGAGVFQSPDTLEVGGQTLRFKRAIIATGARASVPPIAGIEEAGYLTNETVFSMTEQPKRLAVLGAGPLGCELAQAFARLGTKVTLLEASGQIMSREDRDAAAIVEQALRADGVSITCRAKVQAVKRDGADVLLQVEAEGRPKEELRVHTLLIGAGRAANVEGMGLEQAGVRFDRRKGVEVDDHLRTTNRRIYAAGDVCSRYKFTHAADAMARIAVQNALFLGRARMSSLTIPWCTYTDPEIAHVGLYEHEAADQGVALQTFVQPLNRVDRAVLDSEDVGFVKIHVRQGTDRIVGATIVARHAGDLISELTLAMIGKVGLKTLAQTIHPYPTQAESIKKLGDAYNRSRLTPWVKSLLQTWLAWTR